MNALCESNEINAQYFEKIIIWNRFKVLLHNTLSYVDFHQMNVMNNTVWLNYGDCNKKYFY